MTKKIKLKKIAIHEKSSAQHILDQKEMSENTTAESIARNQNATPSQKEILLSSIPPVDTSKDLQNVLSDDELSEVLPVADIPLAAKGNKKLESLVWRHHHLSLGLLSMKKLSEQMVAEAPSEPSDFSQFAQSFDFFTSNSFNRHVPSRQVAIDYPNGWGASLILIGPAEESSSFFEIMPLMKGEQTNFSQIKSHLDAKEASSYLSFLEKLPKKDVPLRQAISSGNLDAIKKIIPPHPSRKPLRSVNDSKDHGFKFPSYYECSTDAFLSDFKSLYECWQLLLKAGAPCSVAQTLTLIGNIWDNESLHDSDDGRHLQRRDSFLSDWLIPLLSNGLDPKDTITLLSNHGISRVDDPAHMNSAPLSHLTALDTAPVDEPLVLLHAFLASEEPTILELKGPVFAYVEKEILKQETQASVSQKTVKSRSPKKSL